MELKQLGYFVQVAELGSYTQAADQLKVPQPTLSKHVRVLERELERTLFERTGRGVVLTEAGQRFYEHALAILAQVERTRSEMSAASGMLTGDCVVGFPPNVGRTITVSLVRACHEQLPHVRLVLTELRSKQVVEQIGDGQIDLGLAHHPSIGPRHIAKQLLSEQLYLLGAAGEAIEHIKQKPVRVAELESYGFVVHGDRQTRRSLILSDIANAKIDLNVVAEVGSTDAVLDLVQAGMGYAVLPVSVLRNRSDHFSLRAIVDPPLETTLSLVTPSRRPVTQLTVRVAEIIEAVVAESLGKSPGVPSGGR
jgi:LysR family transcriptional regulator, nitrogen assimilation regulatory protein